MSIIEKREKRWNTKKTCVKCTHFMPDLNLPTKANDVQY